MNKSSTTVTCYNCNEKMQYIKTDETFSVNEYSLTLRGLSAYVCSNCGEKLFSTDETKMIQHLLDSFSLIKSEKPDILNLDETAKILRVSNQTIYNMIRDGRLKAFKAGREWRIMRRDIEGFETPVRDLYVAARGGKIDSDDLSTILSTMEEIPDA